MKKLGLILAFISILSALIYFGGRISSLNADAPNELANMSELTNNGKNPSSGVTLSIINISLDKPVYHSAEILKLTVVLDAGINMENAVITAAGINNRMNERLLLNLSKGVNSASITYPLPRCNVCGGIKEGYYNISVQANYRGISSNSSVTAEIRQ